MQQLPGIPTLLMIVNSWKRCSIGLLVLLNKTTDQRHWCLLPFLNFAGKPSPIVGETVAYHSCTGVFTVWLVFPPHLFVLPPSHSCSWRRHILCLVLSNRSLKSRPSIHCQWCIAAAARICENGNWCFYMKLCYVAGMRELITVLSGEACTLLSVLLNVHLSAQS